MIDKPVTRRRFLKGATASLLPVVLSGFQFRALGRTPLLETLGKHFQSTGRSLVVIQLGGGNDGLNMVIPYGMSQYFNQRPTIGIPSAQVLQLNTVMGLHPSLAPLHTLYTAGKLCILQGVGYANPNRSHFRATDIWLTGTSSDVVESTGWIGRDLNYNYPDYPDVLTPNPLALQIGGSPSLSLKSIKGDMGVTITDPNQFHQLINGTVGYVDDPPPKSPAGRELRFLRIIAQEAIQYATVIKAASDAVTNQISYPASDLAGQLAIVARLIAGGLQCPIYLVSQGGYDTHSSQLSRQATLFGDLGGAISAFQQDLEALGVAQNVIGMTFSEFGRRISENGSGGTDHGTSSPQFLFGTRAIGGLYGPNPDFETLDPVGDFVFATDFRDVYATILGTWFGASPAELQSVLFGQFSQLPVLQVSDTSVRSDTPRWFGLGQNFPNPFNPSTVIPYEVPFEANVNITLYNVAGQRIRTLLSEERRAGTYMLQFNADELAAGVYIYRMTAGSYSDSKRMLLVK